MSIVNGSNFQSAIGMGEFETEFIDKNLGISRKKLLAKLL